MKIAKRIIALVVMYVGLSSTLLAQPMHKKSLAGIWDLKVKVEHMPGTISALGVCSPEGGVMYVQAAGNHFDHGYGRWVQTGHSEFRLTFVTQTNDKAGVPTGSQHVQGTAILSESDDLVTGTAVVQSLNQEEKVIYSGTAKVEGSRVRTSSPLTAMR